MENHDKYLHPDEILADIDDDKVWHDVYIAFVALGLDVQPRGLFDVEAAVLEQQVFGPSRPEYYGTPFLEYYRHKRPNPAPVMTNAPRSKSELDQENEQQQRQQL